MGEVRWRKRERERGRQAERAERRDKGGSELGRERDRTLESTNRMPIIITECGRRNHTYRAPTNTHTLTTNNNVQHLLPKQYEWYRIQEIAPHTISIFERCQMYKWKNNLVQSSFHHHIFSVSRFQLHTRFVSRRSWPQLPTVLCALCGPYGSASAKRMSVQNLTWLSALQHTDAIECNCLPLNDRSPINFNGKDILRNRIRSSRYMYGTAWHALAIWVCLYVWLASWQLDVIFAHFAAAAAAAAGVHVRLCSVHARQPH